MKIKFLAFLLCLLMIVSVGCGDAISTETNTNTETEGGQNMNLPIDYSKDSAVGKINITTESGVITGAENVTVPRPDESGRVLSAENYLSPEKSGLQNVLGFSNMIAKIKASYAGSMPITKIDIPQGVYRFKANGPYAVELNQMENLVIDGNGSLFIFEDTDEAYGGAAYFHLENCDTVEIRNLTVDFDWEAYPLNAIGTVIAFDTATKTVTFQIDSCELPENITAASGRTWDSAIDNRSETVGFKQYGSIVASEAVDAHTLRVTYSSEESAQKAEVGQEFQFHFHPNFYASAFDMDYNKNITLDNVTVHSASQAIADVAGSDGFHMINCKAVPIGDRRFTTMAGIGIYGVKGNVIIEGCEVHGTLDDSIALFNHFMGGENVKIDDYTVEMRHIQTWSTKFYFYEGATLGLYDKNYQALGWSSVIESVSSVREPNNGMATYTVKFRDPLPEDVESDCKFMSEDYYNGSYIIRNNKFTGGLCHAFYIGVGNGTIENNIIDNYAYPSLALVTVTRWSRWHMGVGVENVVISGNTMTRCNTAQRDPASFAIAAGRDEAPTGFYPAEGYVIRNILVENNVVDGSTGVAFALFSAEDVIVRNNRFLNSNTLPTTKEYRAGWGNVYVCNAQNITWENNTIENDGFSYENGLYIDKFSVVNFKKK